MSLNSQLRTNGYLLTPNIVPLPQAAPVNNGTSGLGAIIRLKLASADASKTIDLDTAALPTSGAAIFQQCQVCVDGTLKTAYVLMTTPA